MKKNISINISGIIFHVEEDAYEKLKNYLGAINQYFASYEDSHEIIADIEGRIAEIFLSKLNDQKQVITREDVDAVISAMGSIRDFQAAQEEADAFEQGYTQAQQSGAFYDSANRTKAEPKEPGETPAPKRLFRDIRRKLVGGVAAGIAHYFGIEPLWIRLLMLLTLFDFFSWFTISGVVFLSYIILWIVMPGRTDLPESEKLRKFFRDPDQRVVAGVANGLAAYFGIDVVIVRLLFVAGIFAGGVGLIAYLVLWAITPEAKSLTDKMQMKGEAITLYNIEKRVKDSLGVQQDQEESTLTKVVLFPFRAAAAVLEVAARTFKPLLQFFGTILRIAIGLLLIFCSGVFIFSLMVALAVYFGFEGFISSGSDPELLGLIQASVPGNAVAALSLTTLLPLFLMLISGIGMLAKRTLLSAPAYWTLATVWVISLIATVVLFVPVINDFSHEAFVQETKTMNVSADTTRPIQVRLQLFDTLGQSEVNHIGVHIPREEWADARLYVSGFDQKAAELYIKKIAKGSSRRKAVERASRIRYDYSVSDSVIRLSQCFVLPEGEPFRAQRARLELRIPYGREFRLNRELEEIMNLGPFEDFLHEDEDLEGKRWVFTPEGLTCLNCIAANDTVDTNVSAPKGYERIRLDDSFTEASINGACKVELIKANKAQVFVSGPEKIRDSYTITVEDGRLIIKPKNELRVNWKLFARNQTLKVKVYVPELSVFEANGAISANLSGFDHEDMTIQANGAVQLEGDVRVNRLTVELNGASTSELSGKAEELNIELNGACHANVEQLMANRVKASASGASHARVHAREELEIDTSIGSTVKYTGNPRVIRDNSN